MPTAAGIDFGTRWLRLAYLGPGGRPQALGAPLPVWQAAGFSEDFGFDLPVKANIDRNEAVRIGKEPVFLADLALHILQFARAEAGRLSQPDQDGCVVSVPWAAGNLHREILRTTCRKAGFSAVRLINESTAVALSQCSPTDGERVILVYCLGAGSLEVAIANRSQGVYRELAAGSQAELSGNALTGRVFNYLRPELLPAHQATSYAAETRLWQQAEQVKIALTTRDRVRLDGGSRGKTVEITRSTFEALIRQEVTHSIDLCRQLLTKASLASPSDLDEIWLAGAAARVPLISRLIAEWSGKDPQQADEYAVAFGAAIQTARLEYAVEADQTPAQEALSPPGSLHDLFRHRVDAFHVPHSPPAATLALPADDQPLIDRVQAADQCLAAGDFDGALEQLGEAVDFFQVRKSRVYLAWGQHLEAGGDLQKALARYQQAVQLDRQNRQAAQSLEAIKDKIRRWEARQEYERGRAYEDQEDLTSAGKSYQTAFELEAIKEYSQAYARVLFKKALLKIEQANSYSRSIVAETKITRGQNQRFRSMAHGAAREARELLEECCRFDPSNREYRRLLEDTSRKLRGK